MPSRGVPRSVSRRGSRCCSLRRQRVAAIPSRCWAVARRSSLTCAHRDEHRWRVRARPHPCGHGGGAVPESFGEVLRRLRGNRSVRDVARLAACGKTHVSDLENGKRQPTRELAAALDGALGAEGHLVALADIRPGSSPLDQADALQQGLHQTLTAGPMTDASLDEWECTVARHGRATRYRPRVSSCPSSWQTSRTYVSY
ncbi:helix-turn-helix transcriptional regulator [Streptomyces sp. NPDC004667]|uniref:helix-turn-helix domain-containing protein n=1 Tax=Streptomyces sp. NPDC004667 TaxID=3154285 RepID=UPI0033A24ADE